jgi:hypothetical protein
MLPPHVNILSAMIGVTFIGPNNVPKRGFPGWLRVDRRRVFNALLWLKRHNPLYTTVSIDMGRLALLPAESAVPDCLVQTARQFMDLARVQSETGDYVPHPATESEGTWLFLLKTPMLTLVQTI